MDTFGTGLPLNALEQDLGATISKKAAALGFDPNGRGAGAYMRWIGDLIGAAHAK